MIGSRKLIGFAGSLAVTVLLALFLSTGCGTQEDESSVKVDPGAGEEADSGMALANQAPTRDRSKGMTAPFTFHYLGDPSGVVNLNPCNVEEGHGLFPVTRVLEQKKGDGPLLVTGDLFPEEPLGFSAEKQLFLDWKMERLIDLYRAMDVTVSMPGPSDLFFGLERLKKLLERGNLNPVCVNLVHEATGKPVFAPYFIEERSGIKIGYLGVLLKQVKSKKTDDQGNPLKGKETIAIASLIKEEGYTLLDPIASASKVADELVAQGVDYIVALAFLSPVRINELLENCAVDLVVGSFVEQFDKCQPVSGGIRLSTAGLGRSVGALKILAPMGFNQALVDRGGLDILAQKGKKNQAKLDKLISRYGTKDSDKLKLLATGTNDWEEFNAARRTKKKLINEMLDLDEQCKNGYYSNRFFPVKGYVGVADGETGNLWKEYLDSMAALVAEHSGFLHKERSTDLNENKRISDPEDCRVCHPRQYDHWQATAHAQAYAPVERVQSIHDVPCLQCHTTGFGCQGGFFLTPPPDRYQGVNCEVCHGFSADHAADFAILTAAKIERLALNQRYLICKSCHEETRSPGFHAASLERKIACPSIDYGAPENRILLQERVREMDRKLTADGSFETIGEYLRAARLNRYIGADNQTLISLIAKANELNPGKEKPMMQYYPLLLREGEFLKALQVMEAFIAENQEHPLINLEIIRLLALAPDPEVNDMERLKNYILWYLQNFEEPTAEIYIYLAMAEYQNGDRTAAEDALHDARQLEPSEVDNAWIQVVQGMLDGPSEQQ